MGCDFSFGLEHGLLSEATRVTDVEVSALRCGVRCWWCQDAGVTDQPRGRRLGGWAFGLFALTCLATAMLIRFRPATDQLADLKVYLGAINHVNTGGGLYEFHASNGDHLRAACSVGKCPRAPTARR